MKSQLNFRKEISKYVLKNTPKGLPKVSQFTEEYLKALFESDDIVTAFNKLDSYNGDGVRFDGGAYSECLDWMASLEASLKDGVSLGDVDPYGGLPVCVQEDVVHFILSDFCSSVGVTYRPEYKEPILRSFVGKTLSYFRWLFSDFMHLPVVDVVVQRNQSDSDQACTDAPDWKTDADPLYYTDFFSRSFVGIRVVLRQGESGFGYFDKLDEHKELLSLVLPARIFLWFVAAPDLELNNGFADSESFDYELDNLNASAVDNDFSVQYSSGYAVGWGKG